MADEYKTLKNKITGGIIWKGLERVCAQLVSSVVSIILARILVPDDYSVVSIVAIFFAFCNLFISSGLNSALIQKKDSDYLDYSTIFVTNSVMAIILYIVMFFCAPIIARLYGKELLTPVIRVMGLTFFINAYKAVLCAKVSSDMQFKRFFWSTIIGTIISAFVGIYMAKAGYGPWALIAQQMTNSLVDSLVLSITTKCHFGLKFSYKRFKRLFAFGGRILLASFITVAYDECRPLIVGLRFSTIDLAFYNKGQSLPSLINSLGNNTLSSTLFPAMSKMQDDKDAVLRMTRRFMQLSSFAVFPMMLGLLGIAENLVLVVFTEKWIAMVPFLMVFSFSYMLDLIQVGNLQAIRALGRSDLILKMEIIKKSSYAVVILLAVIFSPSPLVLAASSIVTSIIATIVNTYPNKKLIGYSFKNLFEDILPNLVPAVIMAVIVLAMNGLKLNMYLLLVVQILAGIIIYVGLALVFKNKNLIYMKDTVLELLHKG